MNCAWIDRLNPPQWRHGKTMRFCSRASANPRKRVAMVLMTALAIVGPEVASRAQTAAEAGSTGSVQTPAISGGGLDPSFGVGGIEFDTLNSSITAHAMAVQPDGKIVVAGLDELLPQRGCVLVRYNVDGSLDRTFGRSGRVNIRFGSGRSEFNAVTVQSDGKIVAAGYVGDLAQTQSDFLIARFTNTGELDTTFAGGGWERPSLSTTIDRATAVAVNPSNGTIVASGYARGGTNLDFAVVRYLPGGQLDTSFDSDGQVTTEVNGSDIASALAIQNDGRIVVGGTSSNSFNVMSFARYTVAGALDTTFNTTGKATATITGTDNVNSIAIGTDQKIVVAGATYTGSDYDFALLRLSANGVLDPTFDGDGRVTTNFGPNDFANAVTVQTDGKIVAAGLSRSFSNAIEVFAVSRYTSVGALDTSFNSGGRATFQVGSSGALDAAVAVAQTGSTIVVAGTSVQGSDKRFAAARLTNNGTLDPTFDNDGKSTAGLAGLVYDTAVALGPDGKIVTVGNQNSPMNSFYVTRHLSSGALDPSFDGDGRVTTIVGTSAISPTSVVVQPDGFIVAVGYSYGQALRTGFLARFQLDGSLDPNFGTGGIVTTAFADETYNASSAGLLDGKLVVVGTTQKVNPITKGVEGPQLFVAVRYLANGALDSSFGTNGRTIFNFGGTLSGEARALAFTPDKKIVVVGSVEDLSVPNGTKQFAVARLSATGALDVTFDGDGKRTTALGTDDSASRVAVQPNGKIVVAGNTISGPTQALGIVRYNTNGSLDTTFDGDGKEVVNDVAYPSMVAVQPDGKIVVGSINGITLEDIGLIRLRPNGGLDASFGTGGVVQTRPDASGYEPYGGVLQPDGKIIIGSSNGASELVLVRYLGGSLEYSGLVPVAPTRVLDTRAIAKPAANTLTRVSTGAPAGTRAALVNLTMTRGASPGFITADKCSALTNTPNQTKSNGNYIAGRDIANSSVVSLDSDGSFCIYNSSPVDLIADVQGFYSDADANGLRLTTVAPARLIDTRTATKPATNAITRVATGAPVGTTAVLVNLTMTRASSPGFITADKCSALTATPNQTKSNGNYVAGQDIANTSVIPLDLDGSFCVYNSSPVDVIADLQGFYQPPT